MIRFGDSKRSTGRYDTCVTSCYQALELNESKLSWFMNMVSCSYAANISFLELWISVEPNYTC